MAAPADPGWLLEGGDMGSYKAALQELRGTALHTENRRQP